MSARRHITLLVLALASFALSACVDPTGPQPEPSATIYAGTDV